MELDRSSTPLHEGTHGDDPGRTRCRASRTATSRSTPGPNDARRDRRRRADRRRRHDRAGRPRPALQHARPEDAQGAPADRPGRRDPVRRQVPRRPNEALKYFNPALSTTSRLTRRAGPRRRARSSASSSTPPRVVGAIAERRDDLADLVAQRERDRARDRRRERRARARARPAAADAAQGEHHVREPARRRSTTSTCWSPSRSRPPRTWRRSSARCARSSRDARADDPRTCAS